MGCTPGNFSAAKIAHAVEDCDAHLINLNVTDLSGDWEYPLTIVDLRVNRRNTTVLERSLERYGYTVLLARRSDSDIPTADEHHEESLRARAREMLYYINM